ncbi:dTMP kinase [Chitinophaga sp. 22321]|uniref:Thymidylate kinase n=1 Tax=Chitinophaga hostae TaxID=2831022 RepID=A0ABS5ISV3_9BACT|nr:dTMP kinase [Chitinophaga hostae]MBS0026036.1 dTMP kinase [Chitinophaga hostae]
MTKFIAVEGLDGAGKSTQIELLTKYLESKNEKTKFVHFPRSNEGVFGELIAKFLRGEFGEVKNVHPQLVALLFAEDRKAFAATINEWLHDGYFVLVDRYVLSNIAFQCAKLNNEEEKEYLRNWILDFEYNYNQIPKPTFSIYLDVPFSFVTSALERRRANEDRDYLQGKDDIHEKDTSLQQAVKKQYEAMVAADDSINRIACFNEAGNMRPMDEIHTEIVQLVNSRLQL